VLGHTLAASTFAWIMGTVRPEQADPDQTIRIRRSGKPEPSEFS
jgi:hypothetical protein